MRLPPQLQPPGLGALPLVPLVSYTLEVDPECRYEGLPHFVRFHDTVTFVGGVNKPKLVQVGDLDPNTDPCPRTRFLFF